MPAPSRCGPAQIGRLAKRGEVDGGGVEGKPGNGTRVSGGDRAQADLVLVVRFGGPGERGRGRAEPEGFGDQRRARYLCPLETMMQAGLRGVAGNRHEVHRETIAELLRGG